MATIFGQKKPWCKLRMMMTLMEVKGHQRSNGVNYVLWLTYLVKRSADASWEWWPLWRSKVIRGQMGSNMCYGYHIWSKEALMQAENDDDLYGGQRSSEVKWGKLCYGFWLPYFVKRSTDANWEWWYLYGVKGHQRSNVVNYVIWLPYLVKRTTDAS